MPDNATARTMTAIGEQMRTIDPLHPEPACYWRKDGKRVAVLFHRDLPGEEVMQIIGDSSRVDHLARLLAAEQHTAMAGNDDTANDDTANEGRGWKDLQCRARYLSNLLRYGCTDAHCRMIKRERGMHTNGGCRCIEHLAEIALDVAVCAEANANKHSAGTVMP